jgi:hypothetical protein
MDSYYSLNQVGMSPNRIFHHRRQFYISGEAAVASQSAMYIQKTTAPCQTTPRNTKTTGCASLQSIGAAKATRIDATEIKSF